MVQRVEVMPPTERRRRYTDEEKARIVEKACAPGSSISAVSREMGVSTSLIFTWRRDLQGLQRAKPDDSAIIAAMREIRDEVERTRRDHGTIRAPLSASVKERLTAVMQAGVSKATVRAHTGVSTKALIRLCPSRRHGTSAGRKAKTAVSAPAGASVPAPVLVPVSLPPPAAIPLVVPFAPPVSSPPAIRELSIVSAPPARPRADVDARVSIKLGKLVSFDLPVDALSAELLRALVEAGGKR